MNGHDRRVARLRMQGAPVSSCQSEVEPIGGRPLAVLQWRGSKLHEKLGVASTFHSLLGQKSII